MVKEKLMELLEEHARGFLALELAITQENREVAGKTEENYVHQDVNEATLVQHAYEPHS